MSNLRSRIVWIAYLTVCWWLLVLPAAGAYIDPGSGSLIIQVVIGFAMASALAAKTFWRRLTGLVHRGRGEDEGTEPSSDVP
jgi:hypothetical protein